MWKEWYPGMRFRLGLEWCYIIPVGRAILLPVVDEAGIELRRVIWRLGSRRSLRFLG